MEPRDSLHFNARLLQGNLKIDTVKRASGLQFCSKGSLFMVLRASTKVRVIPVWQQTHMIVVVWSSSQQCFFVVVWKHFVVGSAKLTANICAV